MAEYQIFEVPTGLLDYVKDKSKSAKAFFKYFLARTVKIFQYDGLPDSIPAKILERYLQVNGIACITEHKGCLNVFSGSLGGEQDIYYRPSQFIIANPHVEPGFSKIVDITPPVISQLEPTESHKGVLIYNDSEWFGLTPLIGRYSTLLAENILTMRTADVMLRLYATLSAPTDKSLKSAEDYLRKLERGDLGVIGDDPFFDGVKVHAPATSNGSYFKQFIEYHQYILGTFYGEIGLRANYNMKREAIGAGETALDEDAVLPLVDNMLECRREWVSQLNDLYNLNISVNFSSAWLNNRTEYLLSLAQTLSEMGFNVSSNSLTTSPTASIPSARDSVSQLDGAELNQDGTGMGQLGSRQEDWAREIGDCNDISRIQSPEKLPTIEVEAITENDKTSEAAQLAGTEEEDIVDKREEADKAEKYGGSEINDMHGNDEVEEVAEMIENVISQLRDEQVKEPEEGVEYVSNTKETTEVEESSEIEE